MEKRMKNKIIVAMFLAVMSTTVLFDTNPICY